MDSTIALPDGFSLDQPPPPPALPAGFVADAAPEPVGVMGRVAHGAFAPIDAGAQMLAHALPNSVTQKLTDWTAPLGMAPFTPTEMDKDIAKRERDYQARRGADAGSFDLAAAVGAAVPTAVLSGPLKFGGPAAIGAASGALSPVTDEESARDNFWGNKALQTVAGAALGKGTSMLGKGVAGVVAPKLSAGVQYLADRGVPLTPGQLAGRMGAVTEEKLSSIPFAGDMIRNAQRRGIEGFNRAVYNEVLAPIGASYDGPVGRDAVGAVEGKISDAYRELLPKLTVAADGQFNQDMGQLAGTVANSTMSDAMKQRFGQFIQSRLANRMAPNQTMDGESFKGLESELSRLSKQYGQSSSFDEREFGTAVKQTLANVRNALERSNPEFAGQLASINNAWGRLTTLQKAASRLGADQGVFTPAQFLGAVRQGDATVRKGAFAKGEARMQELADTAKDVIGSKYPDSGTPGRYLMGALAGAVLGHVAVPPTALVGGAAAALPYTAPGQYLLNKFVTAARPQVLTDAAAVIRKGAVAAPVFSGGLLNQFAGP